VADPKLLDEAFAVLDEAEADHGPRARFALTATTVAMEWAEARRLEMGVAHLKTGTGIPETTGYVESLCADRGWHLEVYEPPVAYEVIVLEHGFPGPGQHGLMYARLKERCLRQLVREHKREVKDRIMLVTGVRSEESARRMRHVERIQREGAQLWAAAIWNWTKINCGRFIADRRLPRNPVVDAIHMSGECLCGAFAKPGELDEIAKWYPEHAAWLRDLEARVGEAGIAACRWGQRPPRVHREQMAIEDLPVGPLCIGCGPE
jgi:3'-phosphoadenosine 5'-phosphosulfate sulfotransferase (PAPS reductase)/FAD synthetase